MFIGVIVLTTLVCLCMDKSLLFIGRKKEIPLCKEGCGTLENYIFSVVGYVAISIICLSAMIITYDTTVISNNVLKDSGVMFAIMLVFCGILSKGTYRLIQKITRKVRGNVGDFLYDFSNDEIKWLSVFSCIVLVMLFFTSGEKMYAYICIAIIIGKFAWLDIYKEQIAQEKDSLKKVPIIIWILLGYFFILILTICWIQDYIKAVYIGIGLSVAYLLVESIVKQLRAKGK